MTHHGTATRVADKNEISRNLLLKRGPVVPFVLSWLCLVYWSTQKGCQNDHQMGKKVVSEIQRRH